MFQLFIILLAFVAPYLFLHLSGVAPTVVRIATISLFAFGGPIAILWFGLKSQMIRPGGKLYQPKFDGVRPQIERNMRILVLAFGCFVLYFLTLPFGIDLFRLATGEKPLRIMETVTHESRSFRSPVLSVSFSDEAKDYELFYPTKPLLAGHTYQLVVLPRSRLILDY